ncbi:WG repeat-containing protein, partial [Picosynechococcus sp. NKBG042902]|uniref:WG repeat-containing protein n=1 Tax=Picosynechococcus sp. NKBG042902 TaxID=490193 RepID=UPI001377C636
MRSSVLTALLMMSAASGTVACSQLSNWVGNPIGSITQQIETVGLWPILVGDRWGYIDKEGTMVINPQFDVAFNFTESLANVWVGERMGYIDKEGTMVINPQFDWAVPFSVGAGRQVRVGGSAGATIDKEGTSGRLSPT